MRRMRRDGLRWRMGLFVDSASQCCYCFFAYSFLILLMGASTIQARLWHAISSLHPILSLCSPRNPAPLRRPPVVQQRNCSGLAARLGDRTVSWEGAMWSGGWLLGRMAAFRYLLLCIWGSLILDATMVVLGCGSEHRLCTTKALERY
ncbi:hypothetical protein BDQ94DRAFT_151882 [Aspergillus welwitschiae]|uniref:Uncharacterized protein n=1 Tax=Aspergillus welwitschiae TaxID=1341132 RepID=A0A3F3PNV7_9EURO|nr:hypothetical protein BDQ94DRAFT_151882 [Aspergillus welwitschiae]RDH28594.1 hypothetical protein BDQ94DRAFT_151882 [Aspergillus welwitschiae]